MDREEISKLYHRLGPLIYRRCLRLLADPEQARDATQEVFVRMLRNAGKLVMDRECLPWLYRVSTNYCLNVIRDGRRLEFHAPAELGARAKDPGIEARLAARQQVLAICGMVDEKTRQIAVMSYLDGMTQEEISGVLGLSRRTVGKKLLLLGRKAREARCKERPV